MFGFELTVAAVRSDFTKRFVQTINPVLVVMFFGIANLRWISCSFPDRGDGKGAGAQRSQNQNQSDAVFHGCYLPLCEGIPGDMPDPVDKRQPGGSRSLKHSQEKETTKLRENIQNFGYLSQSVWGIAQTESHAVGVFSSSSKAII